MATEQELAQALGPAFGVYPKAFRGNYGNPEDAANLPVDVLRGRTAGLLGMFGDVVNQPIAFPPARAAQLAIQGLSGQEQYKYPDTEHFLKTMPLAPTSRVGQVAGQAASFVPLNPAPAVRAIGAAGRALGPTAANMAEQYMVKTGGILPLDVYHGSPHRLPPTERNPLGEFDASKIGTGAGAQARGYGIYTSESPQFADYFAIRKATPDVEGIASQNGLQLSRDAQVELMRQATRDSMGKPTSKANNYIDPIAAVKKLQNASIETRQMSAEKLQNTIREFQNQNTAFLYKADLPDEKIPQMLDLDLPIKDQPEALKKIRGMIDDPDILKSFDNNVAKGITGENAGLNYVKGKTPAERSENLRKAGIPGNVYKELDTRNFVTFPGEEKNLTILERNK